VFTRVTAVERDFRPNYLDAPQCEGQCRPGTEGKCQKNVTFAWEITKQTPAGIGRITAGMNAEKVSVRITGNGSVEVTVTVTLQCLCDNKAEGAPLPVRGTITTTTNVFA
jgi:hypothetical protein